MEITIKISKEELEYILKRDDTESVEFEKVNREIKNLSMYAVVFDETSAYWVNNTEYNKIFLRQQESYMNDKLKAKGHVFLNEVYDALGIPRTKAGQVVGWIYDEENPLGDNYIDLGVFEDYNSDFINGLSNNAFIDPNVDGNILDYLDRD